MYIVVCRVVFEDWVCRVQSSAVCRKTAELSLGTNSVGCRKSVLSTSLRDDGPQTYLSGKIKTRIGNRKISERLER